MDDTRPYVALDSDGTVLDTMGPKQHRFLQPMLVEALGLGPVREAYLACADFVNLHSAYRGISRFHAVCLALTLLNRHPARAKAGLPPLDLAPLKAFVESGRPLSDPSLADWLATHPSPLLETLLRWGRAVNAAILAANPTFALFPNVRDTLAGLHPRFRAGIVSQSPERVLRQDWGAHGLLACIDDVAGQEVGPKPTQIATLTRHLSPGRVLMVGDAFGDLRAARAHGCRFFPILPGREGESWAILRDEVLPAFHAGAYAPEREAALVAAFTHALPQTPPWETGGDSQP